MTDKKQIRDLFEQFVDAESAARAADDVERGDGILRSYSAPAPNVRLIAEIQAKMQHASAGGRAAQAHSWNVWRPLAAAAAVIVIGAAIWLLSPDGGNNGDGNIERFLPAAVWESDDIAAGDSVFAALTAEVNEMEDELLALRLDEGLGNGNGATNDVEMELIQNSGDFWKG